MNRFARLPIWTQLVVLFAAYCASAWLSLRYDVQPQGFSIMWAPSGVLLSALLLGESVRWRWIVLTCGVAGLLVNAAGGLAWTLSVPLVFANLAEGFVTACAIRRWLGRRLLLDRPKEILVLLLFGALLVDGAIAVVVAGILHARHPEVPFLLLQTTYWFSNALGLAIVVPLALTWLQPQNADTPRSRLRLLEQVGAGLAMIAVCEYVFMLPPDDRSLFRSAVSVVPLLLWAILRFGLRGASLMNAVIAIFTIEGTFQGWGPFNLGPGQPMEHLLRAQMFCAVLTLSDLILAAVLAERDLARDELAHSEARHRALLMAIPDALFVQDTDGVYLDCQVPASANLLMPPELFLGKPMKDVLPRDMYDIIQPVFQDVLAVQEPRKLQYEADRPRGKFFYEVHLVPYGKDRIITILRDITENRIAERQIREANEILEERVRERTAEMQQALSELESFSYSVSHDLRSPLRSMDGFARILEIEHMARLDEPGQQCVLRIRANAQRLSQLIEDILEFSRLGRRALRMTPVDLKEVAECALVDVAESYPLREIEISMDDLPTIEGDAVLIRQVFVNLISNAFKFTQSEARPHIEIGATSAAGMEGVFVRDNGAGFDMQHADRLFTVFHRLHVGSEFDGSGVGLAFVHRIVTRHGGRVVAEGAPGEGATFTVLFPSRRSAAAETREPVMRTKRA